MHMLLLDPSARESESAVVQRRQWSSSCSDSVIPTISHLFLQFRNSFLQFVHLVVVKPRSIVSCSPECNLEMTVNWKGKSVLIKRMQTNTLRITWSNNVKHIMRSCGEQLWTVPTCIPRAPTPPLSRTPHQDNTRTLRVNGEPREWWDVLRILKWSLNTKCNVLRTSFNLKSLKSTPVPDLASVFLEHQATFLNLSLCQMWGNTIYRRGCCCK
jgi:hypothetical protein